MDAGFYRGTSADQDGRFTDKERKLLKQMKFEEALNQKVDMSRVNLEVVKPWITAKVNDILGMEDDVVIEYIFTQLEEKNINPKIMQINLTGFLNAKRSREFMGELWIMLMEAQASPDGIPASIVEKKMEELKATGNPKKEQGTSFAKATETDWKNRYDSLTGGRYGKATHDKKEGSPPAPAARRDDRSVRDYRDRDRDRDRPMGPSRYRGGYRDRDWNRDRRDRDDRDRDDYRRRKSRTRSPPSPPARRFKEEKNDEMDAEPSSKRENMGDGDGNGEGKRKKRKKHRSHRDHSDVSDSEAPKRSKKHKKEKKSRKEKHRDAD